MTSRHMPDEDAIVLDVEQILASRAHKIDASGIRRVFDLAARLEKPINLSIGQPHFDVPNQVKQAAIKAIEDGFNKYTQTQGIADLITRVNHDVASQYPHTLGTPDHQLRDQFGTLITSGVSGGLMLLLLACCEPGDDILMPDPYFVMYRHLVTLAGGNPVFVDTYPDFQLTAQRVEQALTPNTKLLLFSSPSNPTGVVLTDTNARQLAQLADDRSFLIASDEIYDRFYYDGDTCPSIAQHTDNVILLRGYSKTYAMTGWRLGYAVGPKPLLEQMTKLQQYSFVCAPSMTQLAGITALDLDISEYVTDYRGRRDLVVERLVEEGGYELTAPGGAFYAFPKVPEHLGISATQFAERAVEQGGVLLIPGSVFSQHDTHFRISYAAPPDQLEEGLDYLVKLGKV